jgi:hypothetical protein
MQTFDFHFGLTLYAFFGAFASVWRYPPYFPLASACPRFRVAPETGVLEGRANPTNTINGWTPITVACSSPRHGFSNTIQRFRRFRIVTDSSTAMDAGADKWSARR